MVLKTKSRPIRTVQCYSIHHKFYKNLTRTEPWSLQSEAGAYAPSHRTASDLHGEEL